MPAYRPSKHSTETNAEIGMKKWLALAAIVLLAIATYVASGPYRTMRAIGDAIQAQDATALSKQIDFPVLRSSLKAQLSDRLVRKVGADAQSSPLAAFGLSLADGMINGLVDTMVTPTGLGAIVQGRAVWNHVDDALQRGGSAAAPARPFQDAETRYESPSRFTATVRNGTGGRMIFVVSRQGFRWRLSDIRLPQ